MLALPLPPAISVSLTSEPTTTGTESYPSYQTDSTLASQLMLDATALDLSDTYGTPTGEPDTPNLSASLVDGYYYLTSSATVDTIGVSIYISWDGDNSQWVMSVNTDGGLTWTGICSSTYDHPAGTYVTASYSDAGSGYVIAL